MPDSLQPRGLQHARLLCPPLSPEVCLNACPLSWWCHPTISSSVVPFSSHPQSFLASQSFPVSQLFTSGGQNYWSLSFSISPSNEHSVLISFTIDQFDLLAVQGALKSLLQHRSLKASIPRCPAFFMVQFLHPYMTTGKSIVLTIQTLIGKVMCLLFNTLSRFVIAFLPWSKHHLISWLHSPSTVTLQPRKIKSDIASTFSFSICHEVTGPDVMIFLSFLNVEF